MTEVLLAGLALVMIFEGLLPFASPALWRSAMMQMAALSDAQLRLAGLAAMVAGLLLLNLVSP